MVGEWADRDDQGRVTCYRVPANIVDFLTSRMEVAPDSEANDLHSRLERSHSREHSEANGLERGFEFVLNEREREVQRLRREVKGLREELDRERTRAHRLQQEMSDKLLELRLRHMEEKARWQSERAELRTDLRLAEEGSMQGRGMLGRLVDKHAGDVFKLVQLALARPGATPSDVPRLDRPPEGSREDAAHANPEAEASKEMTPPSASTGAENTAPPSETGAEEPNLRQGLMQETAGQLQALIVEGQSDKLTRHIEEVQATLTGAEGLVVVRSLIHWLHEREAHEVAQAILPAVESHFPFALGVEPSDALELARGAGLRLSDAEQEWVRELITAAQDIATTPDSE
jgi:hypothetical protein